MPQLLGRQSSDNINFQVKVSNSGFRSAVCGLVSFKDADVL